MSATGPQASRARPADWSVPGVAIVTGAGQGLGRAYAIALAQAGASVVIADLAEDRATAVAREITEEGGTALAVRTDVSDAESVGRMLEASTKELGAPSILVNNAALFSTLAMRPFTEIPDAEWDRVMAVNLRGAFFCSRAVVPLMATSRYGKIINISSATVWLGRPNYLHYVTSKAGIIGFTRALASEVGPLGIRVNAVTPGSTETEIPRGTVTPAQRQAMIDVTPLRRGERPEDLVGTVLFLASHHSDFITGQTINVDGGLSYH
jgi:3-oxoacyl-[acyl-carrier protein] reductase